MGKLRITTHTFNPRTCVPEAGEAPSSRSAYTTLSATYWIPGKVQSLNKTQTLRKFLQGSNEHLRFHSFHSTVGLRCQSQTLKDQDGTESYGWIVGFFSSRGVNSFLQRCFCSLLFSPCYSTAHHQQLWHNYRIKVPLYFQRPYAFTAPLGHVPLRFCVSVR